MEDHRKNNMSRSSEEKTRHLLRELDVIEKKSQAMRKETERLRKLKEEAKHALTLRYPDLFANASGRDHHSEIANSTSVATQSDESSLVNDDIGLNRLSLSKDLQDVYDTLMNFQKRDSSNLESFPLHLPSFAERAKSPNSGLRTDIIFHHQQSVHSSDNLSEMMAAYGVATTTSKRMEEAQYQPTQKGQQPQEGYFIPVDFETFTKWQARLQNNDKKQNDQTLSPIIQPQKVEEPIKCRDVPPVKEQPEHHASIDDIDGGDDTSQDAADLVSQDSKENGHKVEPEPDETEPKVIEKEPPKKAIGSPEKPRAPVRKITESEPDEERDENFVIESDNVDEKLYSSESDSSKPIQQKIQPKSSVKFEKKPLNNLSLSTSSSTKERPNVIQPSKKAPQVLTLQLQTESEDSEKSKPAGKSNNEEDISGPEMDNDDDFWN